MQLNTDFAPAEPFMEPFAEKPTDNLPGLYEEQLHELFTFGFNGNILTAHISKGIFDMYRKRGKLEKQWLEDL